MKNDDSLYDGLRDALELYLRGNGYPSAVVRALTQLSGGASCRIYSFELRALELGSPELGPTELGPTELGSPELREAWASRRLVLRLDAAGGGAQGNRLEEFAVLAAAGRAGVRVPRVHLSGGESAGLGGAFFVMDLVPGEALARRLLRDEGYAAARAAMPEQIGGELARTHAVDLSDPGLAFLRDRMPAGNDPRRFALAEVERYRQLLEGFSGDQPYPLLRLVARCLEQNAPEAERPALVHGDFRIGNLMFDRSGLTAVLDWELSHVGDPVEDLGWLCVRTWRFGNVALAAGGLCSREELLGWYEQAGGSVCTARSLAWWELFGNWKWAIICRMQAERHLAGKWPDVELATIGRRLAETEHEILALLEKVD